MMARALLLALVMAHMRKELGGAVEKAEEGSERRGCLSQVDDASEENTAPL